MRWLGAWAVVLAVLGLSASPASAQQPPSPDGRGTDYFVTVGARVCKTFADISANKARNNIQESLKDLGPDTNYRSPSQYVNPSREQEGQANCEPLSGFSFTFGTSFSGTKIQGSWGSLSVVGGAFPTTITTTDSVPDRDGTGKIRTDVGPILGATTVELSADERALVAHGEVRIQGGTPGDPVLNTSFPGKYAFGALRCSDDNQNGDNVEFVRYPGALRHVYCFAYYVVPPPTSGTIIVTKHISDPPNGNGVFTFRGNISYTPTHDFTLTVVNGADRSSQSFYRAASTPENPVTWTVAEDTAASPGWALTDITCDAPMGSTITHDSLGVSIRLVGGDTVHCTFTDALRPEPGSLLITKLTTGDTGTFPFAVRDRAGKQVLDTQATTTAPKEAAAADHTPVTLPAGDYTISEALPAENDGHWESIASGCAAQQTRTRRSRRRSGPPPLPVTITSAKGQVCQFTNHFVPDGSIAITKTTLGGTGSTSFTVSPYDDPAVEYSQAVTTTAEGAPKPALGNLTGRLALGRYLIQEHGTVSGREGNWALVSVTCDGQPRPFAQGQVVVELTEDRPDRHCDFVNEFTPASAPEPPNPPTPTPPPLGPVLPSFPTAPPDLVLTKRALQSSVRVGSTAEYEITVRNAGPVPAEDVVVTDAPGHRGQLVSARAARADCDEHVPLVCRVGRLAAGEEATIRVRLRATGAPVMRNVAVAGTASLDPRLRNNVAAARVRVRGAGRVVGRCARAGPVAHAAC